MKNDQQEGNCGFAMVLAESRLDGLRGWAGGLRRRRTGVGGVIWKCADSMQGVRPASSHGTGGLAAFTLRTGFAHAAQSSAAQGMPHACSMPLLPSPGACHLVSQHTAPPQRPRQLSSRVYSLLLPATCFSGGLFCVMMAMLLHTMKLPFTDETASSKLPSLFIITLLLITRERGGLASV